MYSCKLHQYNLICFIVSGSGCKFRFAIIYADILCGTYVFQRCFENPCEYSQSVLLHKFFSSLFLHLVYFIFITNHTYLCGRCPDKIQAKLNIRILLFWHNALFIVQCNIFIVFVYFQLVCPEIKFHLVIITIKQVQIQ